MDYAQARLQARFGIRPDESLWQELECAPESAAALEIARRSALKRWVAGIAPRADRNVIEVSLRARWREGVDESASWMPLIWQPAFLWLRNLVDLPALCYLIRGATPLPWMFSDPALQAYARGDSNVRQALLRDSRCAFLKSPCENAPDGMPVSSAAHASRICKAWLDEWRRRWPRWSDTTGLESLASLFETAMAQPAVLARPALLHELHRLFRRSVLCPAAAFIFIAFTTLDLERLRAALLRPALAREGIS